MKRQDPQKPADAPGPARQSNALGKSSREQILAAAEMILKRDGYHKLSTRRVAASCGISVGNLTYHFPSKVQLIKALMVAVRVRYQRERLTVHPEGAADGRAYLVRLLSWMLEDAVCSDTSALFLELWVLAKHYDFGAEILEKFYAVTVGRMITGLAHYFPDTSVEQREQAAYFMLTLSEGTVAVFSRSYKRPVDERDMVVLAVKSVQAILSPA